jgi:hypothetical protein
MLHFALLCAEMLAVCTPYAILLAQCKVFWRRQCSCCAERCAGPSAAGGHEAVFSFLHQHGGPDGLDHLLLTAICASEHQGPGKVPGGAPYALMSDQFAQQRTHACQSVYRLPWSCC